MLGVIVVEEASITAFDHLSDEELSGSAPLYQALDRGGRVPLPLKLSLVIQVLEKGFLLEHERLEALLTRLL